MVVLVCSVGAGPTSIFPFSLLTDLTLLGSMCQAKNSTFQCPLQTGEAMKHSSGH